MKRKPVIHLPRREFLIRGGAGVLGTIIAAGTLPLARALRSIELFSREVMPAVTS